MIGGWKGTICLVDQTALLQVQKKPTTKNLHLSKLA